MRSKAAARACHPRWGYHPYPTTQHLFRVRACKRESSNAFSLPLPALFPSPSLPPAPNTQCVYIHRKKFPGPHCSSNWLLATKKKKSHYILHQLEQASLSLSLSLSLPLSPLPSPHPSPASTSARARCRHPIFSLPRSIEARYQKFSKVSV